MTGPAAVPAYAGFVTRAVALIVDVTIMNAIGLTVTVVVGLVLSALIPGDQSIDLPTALVGAVTWLVFIGGYLVLFWTLTGRTPGMRLMRLEVLATSGEHIGFVRALIRLGGMVLAAIPLGAGFLLALVDDRRQGLHDRLAKTVVVYTPDPHLQAEITNDLSGAVPVHAR